MKDSSDLIPEVKTLYGRLLGIVFTSLPIVLCVLLVRPGSSVESLERYTKHGLTYCLSLFTFSVAQWLVLKSFSHGTVTSEWVKRGALVLSALLSIAGLQIARDSFVEVPYSLPLLILLMTASSYRALAERGGHFSRALVLKFFVTMTTTYLGLLILHERFNPLFVAVAIAVAAVVDGPIVAATAARGGEATDRTHAFARILLLLPQIIVGLLVVLTLLPQRFIAAYSLIPFYVTLVKTLDQTAVSPTRMLTESRTLSLLLVVFVVLLGIL